MAHDTPPAQTSKRRRAAGAALALLALSLLPGAARAEDFYYVVLFAHEGAPNLPRYSHTFATFVRATGRGPCPDHYAVEAQTISWAPASGDIRVLRVGPERGTNLDLPATLA